MSFISNKVAKINFDWRVFVENNVSYISFSMYADEWPADRFTKESGIAPTEVIYRGKGNSRLNNQRYVETVWKIETGDVPIRFAEDEHEEDALFEQLFTQLRPKVELINQYRAEFSVSCAFFVHYRYYNAQTTGLSLSKRVITFISGIGAMVDVYIDNETNWEHEENITLYQ